MSVYLCIYHTYPSSHAYIVICLQSPLEVLKKEKFEKNTKHDNEMR